MQDRICQVDQTSCNARPDHTLGQTEKNSVRLHVFRFASDIGHCSMQSALRVGPFCEKVGREKSPKPLSVSRFSGQDGI
jgi:hypothetical protein